VSLFPSAFPELTNRYYQKTREKATPFYLFPEEFNWGNKSSLPDKLGE
jgi:hypothetical protein